MLIFYVLLSVLLVILGFLPLLKDHKNIAHISFFITCLAISFWIFSIYKLWSSDNYVLWMKLSFVGPSIFPVSTLVFSLYYPKQIIKLNIMKSFLLVLPSFICLALTAFSLIVISGNVARQPIYGFGHKIFAIYFITYFLIVLFYILQGLFVYTGLDRLRSFYLLLATMLSVFFGSIPNLILPLIGINKYNMLGPYGVSFFVGFNLYAMLKHRLMNIRLIISKSFAMVIAIIFLVFCYVTLYLTHARYSFMSTQVFLLVSFSYWFLASYCFDGLRIRLQTTTDQTLLKGKYNYTKVLTKFSAKLLTATHLNSIVNAVLIDICKEIEILSIAIFLPKIKENNVYYDLVSCKLKGINYASFELLNDAAVLSHLAKNPSIIYINDCPLNVKKEMTRHKMEICIPCLIHNRINCLIFLGSKLTEDAYTTEDFHLFNIISSQIAISIERIKPFEKIQVKYRESLKLAEKISQQSSFASLSCNIAHEVHNPIQIILADIDLMQKNIKNKKLIAKYGQVVKESILKISEVTTAMLKFGPYSTFTKESIDIIEILNNILIIASGECKKRNIKLKKEFDKIPLLNGNSYQLNQLFLNIILNSIQAINKNGTIFIRAYTKHEIQNNIEKSLIIIDIEDDGPGIPLEIQNKVFKPFFTTKENQVGLGLTTALKMANDNMGKIIIDATSHTGAKFCISFLSA
jgi:nitrogen-specific signal transduction histidine kinase